MAGCLAQGVGEAFSQAEIPMRINRFGSTMTLFFNAGEVKGWGIGGRGQPCWAEVMLAFIRAIDSDTLSSRL